MTRLTFANRHERLLRRIHLLQMNTRNLARKPLRNQAFGELR